MDYSLTPLVAGLVSVLLVSLPSSDAFFVFKLGRCPTIGSVAGFDKTKFSGIWYEYKRFPTIFQAGQDCSAAVFGDAGDRMTLVNEGIRRLKIFGKYRVLKSDTVEGFATVPDQTKSAAMSVSFAGVQMGGNSPNYFIHDTDYTSYASIFSCAELPGFNIQFAWILTRDRGVAPGNLATLEGNLALAGVDLKNFKVVNQKDC